ncbi:hypothetical protein FACS189440_16890 [Bacteroidia bacterium]|nr:hypothetical protein FACS189440_16890 [Bacteroidia bacterium]
MWVKEFIDKIADGTFTNNDIIEYADQKADKIGLLWNLYFADKDVIETTGKPQITDDRQINRISNAMDIISSSFNISIWNESNTAKPQQPAHFTRQFTADEQKKLFDGLTNGYFLPQGTDYSHFCYVFGGTIPNDRKPFEPLIWQKSLGLLAYMIDILFSDTDGTNLWETTAKCFVWKEKAPNKNSMKNTVSKYRENDGYTKKPKGYEYLDNILRA